MMPLTCILVEKSSFSKSCSAALECPEKQRAIKIKMEIQINCRRLLGTTLLKGDKRRQVSLNG
jgi:hypothetical protein